jgi:ribokinase
MSDATLTGVGALGRVCVIGSFMMDLVVEAPRRPQPGETVFGSRFEMFRGGKGFNQAVASARAGAATTMIGRVGADEFGTSFLTALAVEGIGHADVTRDLEAGTGVGAPVVEPSGENSIIIVPRANDTLSAEDVGAARRSIERADVVLLQLELPIATAIAAAQIARAAGTTVVLNPAPADGIAGLHHLRGCVDVLVPNEREGASLLEGRAPGDPESVARALAKAWGCAVVLTLGGRGCVAAVDGALQTYPAVPVTAVDSVGAGDAFCGTLGAWLASGADLADAVRHANAAGALAVTRRGAEPSMPRRADIVATARAQSPTALAGSPASVE